MSIHDQFITAKEAADLLSYTVAHIRGLANRGKIPAYKRGRAWLFKKSEVQNILIPNIAEETKDGLNI